MRALQVIELEGDARARGRTLGACRKEAIRAFISDWLQSLAATGIGDSKSYLSGMLRESRYRSALLDRAPELLLEVEGIADGAGIERNLLFAAQLMDEEWAYRGEFLGRKRRAGKCSSFAVRTDAGRTLIGQNMDLGGYTDGHQVVLRLHAHGEEPGCLVFTVGGMIGLLGVNACKVAVCVNALPQLPAAREGVPVAFVIRKVLQARTAAEAVHRLQQMPHATGQHYLIADPIQIRSFEASPAEVLEYRSPESLGVIHTNHPLIAQAPIAVSREGETDSLARFKSLSERLLSRVVDLEAAQAALSSADDPEHPVCRLGRSGSRGPAALTALTTGSMISSLDRDAKDVASWVSFGPPSLCGYHRFTVGNGGR